MTEPLLFEPHFVEKPWGGRRLATLLGKSLPPHALIGESWELASLPQAESRVRGGAHAGRTLGELVDAWDVALLGAAPRIDGRFPLLIKLLDARENLSVQVHPRPPVDDPQGCTPGVKHECWYVLHAEPDARLYIGLRPGVTPSDVAAAAGRRELVDLLLQHRARAGTLYMLPSGTLHALGAGVVVAEVQTPSDVTYRVYDWDRVDEHGRARAMHIQETLAHIRFDISPAEILPAATSVGSEQFLATELVHGSRFSVQHHQPLSGKALRIRGGRMRVWIVTSGSLVLGREDEARELGRGEVVLWPAEAVGWTATPRPGAEWLEVTVPGPDGT